MYRWAVYFLKEWQVSCDHVTTFNMDEWADGEGNTLPADDPAAFQNAMKQSFFDKLGALTVPEIQRNFATRNQSAYLSGQDRCLEKRRSDTGSGVWHRSYVPHRLLGTTFCRGIFFQGGVALSGLSAGREATSSDHRAECHYQLQIPHYAGALSRQHYWPQPVYASRYHHRRL